MGVDSPPCRRITVHEEIWRKMKPLNEELHKDLELLEKEKNGDILAQFLKERIYYTMETMRWHIAILESIVCPERLHEQVKNDPKFSMESYCDKEQDEEKLRVYDKTEIVPMIISIKLLKRSMDYIICDTPIKEKILNEFMNNTRIIKVLRMVVPLNEFLKRLNNKNACF